MTAPLTTAPAGDTAGKAASPRRGRAPHPTDTAWWAAFCLLLAAVLAVLPH